MPVYNIYTSSSNVSQGEDFELSAAAEQASVTFEIRDNVPVVFNNGTKKVTAPVIDAKATAIVSLSGKPGIFKIYAENKSVTINLS